MDDTAKYLIHADIVADGVVERSDVVGAIFGQTEGLLGEELDLRTLQRASKVGRINVEIESENGQSFGQVMIATSLDRVETAILAAAFETIDRVGPCRSDVAIGRIEDVRAAKRRDVIERAKTLLGEFDDSVLSTQELIEEVRRSVRVEEITEYEGLPAGPRVSSSDAVIVVEGRADVLALLQYGVKNAIAVEGTNVPEVVASLTTERATTAFLDGDRGGDLILKELEQVGEIDHVALAPAGRSVEDLSRGEALTALREKVAYADVANADGPREAVAATDGSARPAPDALEEPSTASSLTASEPTLDPGSDLGAGEREASSAAEQNPSGTGVDAPIPPQGTDDRAEMGDADGTESTSTPVSPPSDVPDDTTRSTAGIESESAESENAAEASGTEEATDKRSDEKEPETLHGHVRAVAGTDRVRLLDEAFGMLVDRPADETFAAIETTEGAVMAVVLDGELSQRVLDIAAQRGVEQVVAREQGSFVKQPTGIRIRTASQFETE